MRKPSIGEYIGIGVGAMVTIAGVVAAKLRARESTENDLPGRVVSAAKRLIPEPPAALDRSDPAWSAAMGDGPEGAWKYYGEGYGTTCGVVAAYIAFLAGLPAELINRNPPEGSGFAVGEHITRLYQGAKALGWLREPANDIADLRPGDIYCTIKDGATWQGKPASGEHVGIVLSVSEPDASGARTVETADGGQRCANGFQCATRNKRALRGKMLTLKDGSARVAWWIRPGGREHE